MGPVFIFSCLLKFLSSAFYTLHCIGLFLGFFEAIMTEIVSLISFSECTLLVYRKTSDFLSFDFVIFVVKISFVRMWWNLFKM